jgi:hypothetical protein
VPVHARRVRLARVPSLASAGGVLRYAKDLRADFSLSQSREATGKNCESVERTEASQACQPLLTATRRRDNSDRLPTIIVFPVASLEVPGDGENIEHEVPSRSPSHPPRGSSGRDTRRLYPAEHGTTDAAAGLHQAKLSFRGCRGAVPCSALSAFEFPLVQKNLHLARCR